MAGDGAKNQISKFKRKRAIDGSLLEEKSLSVGGENFEKVKKEFEKLWKED